MSRVPLPKDGYHRSQELVRRSLPRGAEDRSIAAGPREQMRRSAQERAVAYASMDDLTDRCHELAEDIEGTGVVLDCIEPDDEDSLVTCLDRLEESLDDESPLLVAVLQRSA